jgi:hypothetical protein
MIEKKVKHRYIKMPNKANNREICHWQGKRKDQVEFSYKMFMIPFLIFGAWLLLYLGFNLIKWLLI